MYERLQATGDLEAAEVLGETYFHGDPAAGVEQDHVRARHMFEIAARQESPGALHNLAMMHLNGMGWEEGIGLGDAPPVVAQGQDDQFIDGGAE